MLFMLYPPVYYIVCYTVCRDVICHMVYVILFYPHVYYIVCYTVCRDVICNMVYVICFINMCIILCYVLANLGGTLGVCLGASLLTLIEMFEFAIISLLHLLFYGKKVKVTADNSTEAPQLPEKSRAGEPLEEVIIYDMK